MFVETVESEVRTMDKVKNITDLQAELDRRTAVEKLAEKLIIDGKFEEAKELLDTLDDDKVEKPVSYTHLDVYKRQAYNYSKGNGFTLNKFSSKNMIMSAK